MRKATRRLAQPVLQIALIRRLFSDRHHLRAALQAPIGHRRHDRLERAAEDRQPIFRVWRDDGIFLARDHEIDAAMKFETAPGAKAALVA